MKRALLFCLAMAFLSLSGTSLADLPRNMPVPGGVKVIDLPDEGNGRPELRYRDRDVLVIPREGGYRALLGIPLSTSPGEQSYRLRRDGGGWETRHFQVEPKEYAESRITIADERMVTPDEEALERIGRERPRIRRALATHSDQDDVPIRFQLPVKNRQTSAFGLQRYINDQRRNPHSGVDIAGATGTPIHAPAPGKVIETGHFYFNGKTVFLDHGQGLISMFAHMDEISVETGDTLETDDLVGKVGMTGRVTGPHLHWSVSLGNTMVNPRYFLEDESPLDVE
ncbi:peptidoglycan DD-metalloendopeptidase family protein [Natronospira sp.]|uniref:peptidoglycan DD-metalloendopeptidase family protein n=1 Tax=Natronospira sp. TaxID=2024970 RepID=UPI003873200B